MENFRTVIEPTKYNFSISHRSALLSIGSCFSENIAKFLKNYKFNIISNPTGILFNPISITDLLTRVFYNMHFTEKDIFKSGEEWKSFHHHSSFNRPNPAEFLTNANRQISEANKLLLGGNVVLIITLGTAFFYKLKKNSLAVANCHKEPAEIFIRKFAESQTIVKQMKTILEKYLTIDNMRIILTVSPIRYLRDNFRENTLSKAVLHTAVASLQREFNIDYFPSYELLIDDLRDYRFYDESLNHPSKLAVGYIIDKFRKFLISENSNKFIDAYNPILTSKQHLIKTSSTHSVTKFVNSNLQKIERIKSQYSYINFDDDIKYFQSIT